MDKGKAIHRTKYMHDDDFTIVSQFQSEYRGFVEAYNRSGRLKRLKWMMEWSLTKTLAAKHQTSIQKIYNQYQTTLKTTQGDAKVLRVTFTREDKEPLVATWGGITLSRPKGKAVLIDRPELYLSVRNRSELIKRLTANECERCSSQENVEVHHIKALRDLIAIVN
jgi:hypothetical protein